MDAGREGKAMMKDWEAYRKQLFATIQLVYSARTLDAFAARQGAAGAGT